MGLAVGLAAALQGCAVLPRAARQDLPHFIEVDEHLFRGAQPTREGLRQLARRGVKTVICLRQRSPMMESERRLVEGLGMRWVQLPMWFWWRPSQAQIHAFLAAVDDPDRRPVFVHCRQGRNRVGILVAIYRVARQG